jgi:hypothetical protein
MGQVYGWLGKNHKVDIPVGLSFIWMDAYVKPQLLLVSTAQNFEGLARNLTQKGTVGWAHVLHPTFQIFEFGRNLSS